MKNSIKNQNNVEITTENLLKKRGWLSVWYTLCRWNRLRIARNQLSRLSSTQLRDIGLKSDQVKREETRTFWR